MSSIPTVGSLFGLDGRVALVTGAGGGLGRAMAFGLAGAGAHVCVNDIDAEACRTSAELIGAGKATALPFSVDDAAARDAAIDRIDREQGRLDILVNCVGIRHRVPIEDMEADDFNRVFANHVTAGLMFAKRAAPIMRRQRYGRIILITSIAATQARAGDIAYHAAKGAISSMARALACEFGADGITCNAIAPGLFATEANRELLQRPEVLQHISSRVPLKRFAEPPELAGAAVFLASPAASYISGHVLTVDGGMTIHV